uniref:Reverse transcriptase domain-containing protein n=1 Tax=Oryza brachyantha TaxID=4533 RepID=J3NC32_ORYBR
MEANCGDPSRRPGVRRFVAPWTAGMSDREATLSPHALLATVRGNRLPLSPAALVAALENRCAVHRDNVRVEVCAPHDFLVTFANPDDANRVVLLFSGNMWIRGCRIDFCHWSRWAAAGSSEMKYLVKLGRCHLVELLPPADARTLEVLAWAANPDEIPKEALLAISDSLLVRPARAPDSMDEIATEMEKAASPTSPPAPPTEKRCLEYTLLVHLMEIVDPNPAPPIGVDGTGPTRRSMGGSQPFGGRPNGTTGGFPHQAVKGHKHTSKQPPTEEKALLLLKAPAMETAVDAVATIIGAPTMISDDPKLPENQGYRFGDDNPKLPEEQGFFLFSNDKDKFTEEKKSMASAVSACMVAELFLPAAAVPPSSPPPVMLLPINSPPGPLQVQGGEAEEGLPNPGLSQLFAELTVGDEATEDLPVGEGEALMAPDGALMAKISSCGNELAAEAGSFEQDRKAVEATYKPLLTYSRRRPRPMGRPKTAQLDASLGFNLAGSDTVADHGPTGQLHGRADADEPQVVQIDLPALVSRFVDSITTSPASSVLGRPPASEPIAKAPRRFIPQDFTPRRSPRINSQGNGARRHVVSKAQQVMMKKLGVDVEGNDAAAEATKKYAKLFCQPLSTSHVRALGELLGLQVDTPPTPICGPGFDQQASLPAAGTRGGILVAWQSEVFLGSLINVGQWSITILLQEKQGNRSWFATFVYGPQRDEDKLLFLQELQDVKGLCGGSWLIAGDFNMIISAEDKNNSRVNRRMMRAFRNSLNSLEVKELYLFGRRYTWSNEQQIPTLVRLDRVFVSTDWEDSFTDANLQALSSSASDHCPLLLSSGQGSTASRHFHFENCWTKMEGFHDIVNETWLKQVNSDDPYIVLYVKMARLTKNLRIWGQRKISSIRLQLQIAHEVIFRLDLAQETRLLTPLERRLSAACKGRCLALASLERIRWRQRAKITALRNAGQNFLRIKTLSRRRKLYIPRLEHNNEIATAQGDMEELARSFFQQTLGSRPTQGRTLNLTELGTKVANLQELKAAFTEEEVWSVIKALPNEKLPGPDGFTNYFYQSCWDCIKVDVMAALNKFYQGNTQNLRRLNTASITLLPKKEGVTSLTDYRPISLVHSFSKLVSKVMAVRLAKRMGELTSLSQTAFIRGRSIHENFIFVRGLALKLHKGRRKAILLKLDITKAFDSVSWPFLADLLRHRGFGHKWRTWMAALLSTAETTVKINGSESLPFKPTRGLRQGDPLSPLMFVLVMDVLRDIFSKATDRGLLSAVDRGLQGPAISLYADDAVIFFAPTEENTMAVKGILSAFGEATGLTPNLAKSSISSIRCHDEEKEMVANYLQCKIQDFPITYLGLPLSLRRLTRADLQPTMDRFAKKVSGWKPKLLSTGDRLTLINSVLMALPVHLLSVLAMPQWAIKEINRKCRRFLWKGQETVNGGHCLVAWDAVCMPKQLGGLGIKDINCFGKALRLKWAVLAKIQKDRPWATLSKYQHDRQLDNLFYAATNVQVGDGKDTEFWKSTWLPCGPIRQAFKALFSHASKPSMTVHQGMHNRHWIRTIRGATSNRATVEYLQLWDHLEDIQLDANGDDSIFWGRESHGNFTASSTYEIFFLAKERFRWGALLWKTRAPTKIRFFIWLTVKE